MSKKILVLMLALVLIASVLTACGTEKVPNENTGVNDESKGDSQTVVSGDSDLVDGEYLIKGEVTDKGNFTMVTLSVKDGQAEELNFSQFLIDSGERKSHENYPYGEAVDVVADLNSQFNEKKDLNAIDYDAVSGATHTKDDFKEMVGAILAKATKGETYEPVYTDGVYEAVAEEAEHGWLAQVKIVVVDGQIVGLDYAEVAVEAADGVEVGDRKTTENYPYAPPVEVATAMQRVIIDNNGTENLDVDGISGATSTRDGMIELVNQALSSAK